MYNVRLRKTYLLANLITERNDVTVAIMCVCGWLQNDDDDDVDDDVSSTCQPSELNADEVEEVDVSSSTSRSRAFQLTVRGLCALGRLLMAVVKAVLRLCTSSRDADNTTSTSTTQSTRPDVTN